MSEANDIALLREYATRHSEQAFEEVVRRHVGLVYAVALRLTRNPAHAEEITQTVFIILSRKAAGLRPNTVLPAWLHETARFVTASFLRGEARRHHREQEAYMQSTLQESTDDLLWDQLAPLLDEAIGQLNKADRSAVVLRFFQNKSAREIAISLNVPEAAAQKRVTRAVEKLRVWFSRHGVAVSAGTLSNALLINSVPGVPAHLAASITTGFVNGTATSISTASLIKGALKIMAWTKIKTSIVVGVGILLVAGTTTVAVKTIYDYRTYSWEVQNPNMETLRKARPQIAIVPAKFPPDKAGWVASAGKGLGIGARMNDLLQFAYATDARMIFATDLPQARYDFIANLPQGSEEAMRTEIKKKFGLVAERQTIETNVLVLTVKNPNAPGLKQNRTGGRNNNPQLGEYSCVNQPISSLAYFLELYLGTPIINRTGLKGGFDMDVKWDEPDIQNRNVDGLKQALQDQLGLELVPAREPVEFVVIEKVN